MAKYKENIKCSFCGKDKRDALMLIAGIDGHICETCVEQAYDIIGDELKTPKKGKGK
ncbi:MAG: ClpX C4-type zinc finger protein, partial [Saprospiraceae bacterium]